MYRLSVDGRAIVITVRVDIIQALAGRVRVRFTNIEPVYVEEQHNGLAAVLVGNSNLKAADF